MQLPKILTTVTPASKFLSMVLFIILPMTGYYLGMEYQKRITLQGDPSFYEKDFIVNKKLKVTLGDLNNTKLKYFKTKGIFHLNDDVIKAMPLLTKGNLEFNYPDTWEVNESTPPAYFNKNLNVAFLGFTPFKTNLSKDHSLPDTPTKNIVVIDFYLKNINIPEKEMKMKAYDLFGNFKTEFGFGGSPSFNLQIKETEFKGYPAAYQYKTVEEADSPEKSYPERIIIIISPTTALGIDINFYDVGTDKIYSENTIAEINNFIDSIYIKKTITLSGNLNAITPEVPEGYYYELILDKPFFDQLQSSGNPYINTIPLVPENTDIKENLNKIIGNNITVDGTMEWGLSESRYLSVFEVKTL